MEKLVNIIMGVSGIYIWIYFLCAWPAYLTLLIGNAALHSINEFFFSRLYILSIIMIVVVTYLSMSKVHQQIMINFIRPKRLIHYSLLILAGSLIYLKNNNDIFHYNNFFFLVINYLCGITAFILMFISTTILNDFTDQVEDKINNKLYIYEHPELTNHINKLAWILSLLSLILGFVCSPGIFFTLLMWFALNIVYSNPPLRLKRWIFTSNFIIGTASVLAFAYGFFLLGTNSLNFIPPELIAMIFFVTFTGTFIKDIPDENGDRVAGIKSFPVLFPLINHRFLYLILLSFCYAPLFYYSILKSIFSLLLTIPAIVGVISIIKKPRDNYFLFLAYFISFVLFVFIYFIETY